MLLATLIIAFLTLAVVSYGAFKMATNPPVTRQEFDAGLTALIAAEAARDAAVTTALTDLIAKINAGTVPPEDFTAELNQVLALQQAAAALTQTATSDDPGPTTVTPPAPPPVEPAS